MLRSIRKGHNRQIVKPAPFVMPTQTAPQRGDRGPAGVIYVAYGEKARLSVVESIKSLHAIHRDIPAVVISNEKIEAVDTIIRPEADIGARTYKTQVYTFSPFSLTLYLDADTQVVGSLQAGFDAVAEGWDVAAAYDFRPTLSRVDHLPPNDLQATIDLIGTKHFPHYNTGMLFFNKSEQTEELFRFWYEEWQRFKYRDQGAFMRAYYRSSAKLWPLAWQWNTHRQEKALHIFHEHHRVDRSWRGA